MRIVNGCRHFLKKKHTHKKSAQFLIAFLMMLVLFANGPKWELLMVADIFWKKKSAQFPNSIPNGVSPESISLVHSSQTCNGCQHRPAEPNTSPESHRRGDRSREIRFVRKGCERAENPRSKRSQFRPIDCSATNERPRPGISTTERRRKIKGCPQKFGLPRPGLGCCGQATSWGKGKGIASDRVMWLRRDMDGWIEVEKGIPTIYNLGHLFVQFRNVRLLAQKQKPLTIVVKSDHICWRHNLQTFKFDLAAPWVMWSVVVNGWSPDTSWQTFKFNLAAQWVMWSVVENDWSPDITWLILTLVLKANHFAGNTTRELIGLKLGMYLVCIYWSLFMLLVSCYSC